MIDASVCTVTPPAGATGATGATGPAGAAPILWAGAGNSGLGAGTVRYLPWGFVASTAQTTALPMRAPRAGTIKNLFIQAYAGVGTGNVVYTLYVGGVATALTVTVAIGSTSGSNTSASVVVAQNAQLAMTATADNALVTAGHGDPFASMSYE